MRAASATHASISVDAPNVAPTASKPNRWGESAPSGSLALNLRSPLSSAFRPLSPAFRSSYRRNDADCWTRRRPFTSPQSARYD